MRRGDFRDPAIVLEEKQNRTCLGCNQLERSRWSGTTKYVCSIGMQKASTNVYEMPRCKKYSDGESMTRDQSEQIEELLLNWYRWQICQSNAELLAHYYRPVDHTCRGYETPSDGEELAEDADRWVDNRLAAQVDTCMEDLTHRGVLTGAMRAAISTSMHNKEIGRTVWCSGRVGDQHATYQAAKEQLLKPLTRRNLLRPI